MQIEFDARKNSVNIRDRGLSFENAANFDFESAFFVQDTRREVLWYEQETKP